MKNYYLAIDIGASSGRHIIGYLNEKGELEVEEMHRFPNGVKEKNGHLIWDIDYLFLQVKEGIKKCFAKYPTIQSLSIDTWGVDYVLLDENDKEIYPVYAYRDGRSKEAIEKVHSLISFDKLYSITGSQFQPFNTIYQFYDDLSKKRLAKASSFLMIPEYLTYKLSGVKAHEYTNASTTGMLDTDKGEYSKEIIHALGFKESLFTSLEKPGYVLGDLKEDIQKEVGGNLKVRLCPTHDTGAAVEGIQMKEDAPYISSGTWSLLGVKSQEAIKTKLAEKSNYSNEAGPDYIRFQKNIMGLWIIQGLAKQMKLDFPTMVQLSKESKFNGIYDVNDPTFLSSLDMKKEIKNWFISKKLEAPIEDKDLINTTYRSLANSYRIALEELESITKKNYSSLYIVGGGAKNQYLNELTEAFTKKKVIALPIEATSIGNLLSQIK